MGLLQTVLPATARLPVRRLQSAVCRAGLALTEVRLSMMQKFSGRATLSLRHEGRSRQRGCPRCRSPTRHRAQAGSQVGLLLRLGARRCGLGPSPQGIKRQVSEGLRRPDSHAGVHGARGAALAVPALAAPQRAAPHVCCRLERVGGHREEPATEEDLELYYYTRIRREKEREQLGQGRLQSSWQSLLRGSPLGAAGGAACWWAAAAARRRPPQSVGQSVVLVGRRRVGALLLVDRLAAVHLRHLLRRRRVLGALVFADAHQAGEPAGGPEGGSARGGPLEAAGRQGAPIFALRSCSLCAATAADLMLMPLAGSTSPSAALCTGLIERSAHLTSHTTFASNHTSGTRVSPYLHHGVGLGWCSAF